MTIIDSEEAIRQQLLNSSFWKPSRVAATNSRNPVVRVQARRLRTRLTKYYQEEGAHDSIGIEMPKGGTLLFSGNRTLCLPVLASRNTITAAPFLDQSPAGDLGYFCGGLTPEMCGRINRETTRGRSIFARRQTVWTQPCS
jgi:hypothetical protein